MKLSIQEALHKLNEGKQEIIDLEKNVKDLDKEIKDLDRLIKDKNDEIEGNVKRNPEYLALQKEAQALRDEAKELEDTYTEYYEYKVAGEDRWEYETGSYIKDQELYDKNSPKVKEMKDKAYDLSNKAKELFKQLQDTEVANDEELNNLKKDLKDRKNKIANYKTDKTNNINAIIDANKEDLDKVIALFPDPKRFNYELDRKEAYLDGDGDLCVPIHFSVHLEDFDLDDYFDPYDDWCFYNEEKALEEVEEELKDNFLVGDGCDEEYFEEVEPGYWLVKGTNIIIDQDPEAESADGEIEGLDYTESSWDEPGGYSYDDAYINVDGEILLYIKID